MIGETAIGGEYSLVTGVGTTYFASGAFINWDGIPAPSDAYYCTPNVFPPSGWEIDWKATAFTNCHWHCAYCGEPQYSHYACTQCGGPTPAWWARLDQMIAKWKRGG